MIGKADVRDFEDCLIMSVLTLKLTYIPTLYNPTFVPKNVEQTKIDPNIEGNTEKTSKNQSFVWIRYGIIN